MDHSILRLRSSMPDDGPEPAGKRGLGQTSSPAGDTPSNTDLAQIAASALPYDTADGTGNEDAQAPSQRYGNSTVPFYDNREGDISLQAIVRSAQRNPLVALALIAGAGWAILHYRAK